MKKLAIAALCTVFTVGAFAYENYNEAMKAGMDSVKIGQAKMAEGWKLLKEEKVEEQRAIHKEAQTAYAAAVPALKEAIEKATPEQKYRPMLELARALYFSGNKAEAIPAAKAIPELPNLTEEQKGEGSYTAAWLLVQLSRQDEAEKIIEAFVSTHKTDTNWTAAIYLDLYPSILINKKDFAGAERIVSDLKEMKLPKASADRIAPLEKRI